MRRVRVLHLSTQPCGRRREGALTIAPTFVQQLDIEQQ